MAIVKHKSDNVNLSQDDFDAGPVNLDVIEAGLLLGNLTAATDVEALELHGVSHILTVDSVPLPRNIIDLPTITNKFIQVTDNPHEDLISHFDDVAEFISSAQRDDKVVLVHCYFGVSRSATMVLAFIMKKYSLDYEEALQLVLKKRKLIGPNAGFESQLRLYHEMGWTIIKSHLRYKLFRCSVASDKFRKAKILPQDCSDVIKDDPGLNKVNPEPVVYRCRSCRRIIASASNVFPHHVDGASLVWNCRKSMKKKFSLSSDNIEMKTCSASLFIEPLAWMCPSIQHEQQGKLHCPKCKSKIGAFSWVSGCQCSCGTKQAPAFYLVPSKLDWCTVVQNLQLTV